MRGHECLYLCADDTHGTPIMIRARREGIEPEALIARSHAAHTRDFADFEIAFDNFYTTHSPENREFCQRIFAAMEAAGHVACRDVPQLYCDHDGMFLPDRFVRGTCPQCGAANQYGDSCDACGATYSPSDMKDACCAVCGSPPVVRASEHLFVELEQFREYLREWIPQHTARDVANKLLEWFGEPLKSWDISRDAPYFGFEIPGHPGKYFYVWLDAPVGYLASLRNWCDRHGRTFDDLWNNPDVERYHFIGKDIVRFHCLFWPSMLKAAGFLSPNQVFVHGFLTVNGEKMSKSKGTFVSARTYLDHLDPMHLRFYYACKLNGTTDDVDLNLDEFAQRVNSELVGKITNLASRGAQMLHKRLDGRMGSPDAAGREVLAYAQSRAEAIAGHYEARDFARALVEVRDIADRANRYFDEAAPWLTIKTDPEAARATLTSILNHFRVLAVYLKPVLPRYAEKVEALFGEPPYTWASAQRVVEDAPVAPYEYLAQRVETEQIAKIVEASKPPSPPATPDAAPAAAPEAPAPEPPPAIRETVDYDTFAKTDLRVAQILSAEHVEGSDKLLRLRVSLGPLGERQIFAGIRAAYADPTALVGRNVVVVANLAPRKMRFGVSEGMVLAAGHGAPHLFVLSPDPGARPGDAIK
jgi:methionyl-tRNA synthetase